MKIISYTIIIQALWFLHNPQPNVWNGKEVLLPTSVCKIHLWKSAHDESFFYIETLKVIFSSPESVVKSKHSKNTVIANLKLTNREHKYLHVVLHYKGLLKGFKKPKNYIATFYGSNEPKQGEVIWPK
jgi:hypothetical protein